MQRLYETVFIAGLFMMPICVGLGLLFWVGALPFSPVVVWLPWAVVVVPLSLVCLTLRCLSRRRTLHWPQFITLTQYFWANGAAALLCVGAMSYVIWFWPKPLTPRDGAYADGAGKLYSRAEFDAFERWEAVANYFCPAFAISCLLGMPVSPLPTRRTAADQSAAATQS